MARQLLIQYVLRMEVYDDPDSPNIVATFELPGVKTADLSISLKPGELEISGQRFSRYRANRRTHPSVRGSGSQTNDEDDPGAQSNARFFPYREMRYGAFYRRLHLPPDIDVRSNMPIIVSSKLSYYYHSDRLHVLMRLFQTGSSQCPGRVQHSVSRAGFRRSSRRQRTTLYNTKPLRLARTLAVPPKMAPNDFRGSPSHISCSTRHLQLSKSILHRLFRDTHYLSTSTAWRVTSVMKL
jgi:HSP20 family molecular chaperone IbpA